MDWRDDLCPLRKYGRTQRRTTQRWSGRVSSVPPTISFIHSLWFHWFRPIPKTCQRGRKSESNYQSNPLIFFYCRVHGGIIRHDNPSLPTIVRSFHETAHRVRSADARRFSCARSTTSQFHTGSRLEGALGIATEDRKPCFLFHIVRTALETQIACLLPLISRCHSTWSERVKPAFVGSGAPRHQLARDIRMELSYSGKVDFILSSDSTPHWLPPSLPLTRSSEQLVFASNSKWTDYILVQTVDRPRFPTRPW